MKYSSIFIECSNLATQRAMPQTSSTGITLELGRNAELGPHPGPTESESAMWTRSPGPSHEKHCFIDVINHLCPLSSIPVLDWWPLWPWGNPSDPEGPKQCCPIELSVMMGMFYMWAVKHSSHWSHKHLKCYWDKGNESSILLKFQFIFK